MSFQTGFSRNRVPLFVASEFFQDYRIARIQVFSEHHEQLFLDILFDPIRTGTAAAAIQYLDSSASL